MLIYPSGRRFGELGTAMLTWALVQKVPTSVSTELSFEAQYPLSPPNGDAKSYILILFYKRILFFHPIHCSEEIISIPSHVSELGFMSPSHRLWYFLCSQAVF